MLYKNVWLDLECLYMPELLQSNSVNFIKDQQPCVAHLPDIERGFETVVAAKKYIDKNLKRIKKECAEHSKKHGLPF